MGIGKNQYGQTYNFRSGTYSRPLFFIIQYNAQSLTISFSSDYSAGCYQLRGEVEQVF
jgi:hypothetical protein